MNKMRRFAIGLTALMALGSAGLANAQAYPNKPVRLVVPFPPGGTADNVARAYGQELAKAWGQPVVIENRAGAGTTIGADVVAKSPADGYTIFLTNTGHSSSAAVYRKLPYNVEKDFAPVTLLGEVPSILAVTPSLPVNNVKELIALAKAKPGTITFASAGTGSGSHLMGEYLKSLAGIDIVHVPYKGTAPAYADLASGRVSLIFEPVGTVLPHIRAGKLKALGVTTTKRSPAAPDIAPIADSVPGYDTSTWYGVLVPAGTPADVVSKLHGDLVRITKSDEMRMRLLAQGLQPAANTPEQFAVVLKADLLRWAKLVKDAGITPE
ncbi:MAG: tripartite tricarboxylate transporter substrate binding protein [Pseudomonadota bacterium]